MSVLQGLFNKVKYLTARQKVVAHNIARANMPKQQAFDIKAPNFAAEMSAANKVGLARKASDPIKTSASHLSGTVPLKKYGEDKSKRTYEITPSGNNINIEEQMVKASEIQMQMKNTQAQIRKFMEMMRFVSRS